MKQIFELKKEIPSIIVLLTPFALLLINWNILPDELPIHWNINGEADRYGPNYLLPLINVGVYFLLLLLPLIDPRKQNYKAFSSSFYKIRLFSILFFCILSILVILNGINSEIKINRIILILVNLLFIVLGNYLVTIKSNWFFGIKTPWTLDNEYVWRKTHYFSGKLFFWIGLCMLILSFMIPLNVYSYLLVSEVILLTIIPITYSYIIYKKQTNS